MKKNMSAFLLLVVILVLSGCTANMTDPEISFEPPKYVEQMPAKEDRQDFASTGSIFGQGDNPLFSDHKAMHVNDIVMVEISETTASSSSGTKQLSESDEFSLGNTAFASNSTSNTINRAAEKLNNVLNPAIGTGSTKDYTGQGSATKDSSFSTTISARVVKVLENGNYFISGNREILIDDQKQIIQISGVIRPYDIDQNNKITSAQMSEAKILYKTQGDVDQATKQSWGSKIIHAVMPF